MTANLATVIIMTRALVFALLSIFASRALAVTSGEAAFHAFQDRFCLNCHDGEVRRGGLDLEGLPFDPEQKTAVHVWEKAFDRVAEGKMPPEGKAQPSAAEREEFVRYLGEVLLEVSLQKQREIGRVPHRRLTRTEYEYTIRDLLKVETQLRDFFPDDAVTDGFDKVSEGLNFSAAHFLAYQEAADKALEDALPRKKFRSLSADWTGQNGPQIMARNQASFANYGCWLKDSAFVIPSQMGFPYTTVLLAAVPRAGRYRVRVTAEAIQTDGKSLSLAISLRGPNSIPWSPVAIDWHDIPAGATRTVSTEWSLEEKETFHVYGWTLPHRNHVIQAVRNSKGKDDNWRWPGASLAISRVEIEGPLKGDGTVDVWPTESYQVLFDDLPLKLETELGVTAESFIPEKDTWAPFSANPEADAARLLRRFLPLAFRRPVSEDVQRAYIDRVEQDLERGMPFHRAMLSAYKMALCSPHFLLFDETPGALDAYAIASRLSYFLWCSAPDRELLDAAASGELTREQGRRAQTERMLNHRNAARFDRVFTDQWLDLQKIDATSPDDALYPEYDRILKESSLRETRAFFHELIAHDLSLLNCIDSDWTFVNDRLARHYGLPAVEGSEMRRVALPADSRRGGLLTQATILKVTADGAKTSPILRGIWVCERILGITPPPPPPDVGTIEPDIRGATTIREQLKKHRSSASCSSCHVTIDPPGFALESFDVIGGWRDHYRVSKPTETSIVVSRPGDASVDPGPTMATVHLGSPVEQGYILPDGRTFTDISDYKAKLLEDPDGLARAFAGRLLTFATGAPVQFADRSEIDRIVSRIKTRDYGMRMLIHEVVSSRPFLSK